MPSPLPPYIEAHKKQGRTLCLCFDGTSESYCDINSNVVKIFSLLKKDDPSRQMVYYQSGIGTYVAPALLTKVAKKIAKLTDQAFAYSIDSHVMSGYGFLMDNWEQGDRICLFGFSRGAYTARALAGMLYEIGLLPKGLHEEVSFAYSIYRHEKASAEYKRDFCRTVTIEFIGVFDTVSAVGFLIPRTLPFDADNHITRTFRHAISLDEHRAFFAPQPWVRTVDAPSDDADWDDQTDEVDIGKKHVGTIRTGLSYVGRLVWRALRWVLRISKEEEKHVKPSPQEGPPTDVKEVYFAGCHGDIGGGTVPNDTQYSLCHISLRWMIKEILIAPHAGILWNEEDPRFAQLGIVLHPKSDDTISESAPSNGDGSWTQTVGSSSQNTTTLTDNLESGDHYEQDDAPSPHLPVDARKEDVVAPIHDPLKTTPGYWLLEFLPLISSKQDPDDRWRNGVRFNVFRGRTIPEPPSPTSSVNSRESSDKRGANISSAPALWHISVSERMRASPEELRAAAGKKECAFWRWWSGGKFYVPRATPDGDGKPVSYGELRDLGGAL